MTSLKRISNRRRDKGTCLTMSDTVMSLAKFRWIYFKAVAIGHYFCGLEYTIFYFHKHRVGLMLSDFDQANVVYAKVLLILLSLSHH